MFRFSLEGFNASVGHAFLVLAPFGVGMFAYIFHRAWKKSDWFHYFDSKHNRDANLKKDGGDFTQHYNRYESLAKLAITLSAGAVAFLINALANQKPPLTQFSQRLTGVAPIAVGFFAALILFLITFLLWLIRSYEEYCHSAQHDTYAAWKYAVSVSLGVMGFIGFILGFVWLGVNISR